MKLKIHKFTDKLWLAIPVLVLLGAVFFTGTNIDNSPADDIEELDTLIDNFQEAYSSKNLTGLRGLFFADAVVAYDFDHGETQRVHSLEDWLQGTQESVFEVNDYISDVLTNREIEVFRNIGYAICDYRYVDDDEIGTGIDIFTFMKKRGTWKILSLQFTGDEEIR